MSAAAGSLRTPILIVGSGGNAIATAALLGQAGYDDLLIITKHNDFGGAWLQNTYPGCEVDSPSAVYQFEFEPNHRWSALFAGQPELLTYLKAVAEKHSLYERTRFGVEMLEASWSESTATWLVSTDQGPIEASVLILATGFLEEPVVPDISGLDEFRGRIFHSSVWPDGYVGTGDRVAVVGSGSSAIQIVPALARAGAEVLQFQRTPTYVVPKNNRRLAADEIELVAGSPEEQSLRYHAAMLEEEENWAVVFLATDEEKAAEYAELSRAYLSETVKDPAVRAALTPSHKIGCKRPLISDDYYASLNEDNVTLVPEAVVSIGADSVTVSSGRSFAVDTIVLATGFFFGGHILARIYRRDGRSVADHQAGHPCAFRAVSLSGCPNLFLVGGSAPNGQIWNGIYPGQAVASYIAGALDYMKAHGIRALEVRESEERAWKSATDAMLDLGPTVVGGCANYSQDEAGHNKAAWPGSLASMRDAFSVFDADAYDPVCGGESR